MYLSRSANPESKGETGDKRRALLEVGSQEVDDPVDEGSNAGSSLDALCVSSVKQVLETA